MVHQLYLQSQPLGRCGWAKYQVGGRLQACKHGPAGVRAMCVWSISCWYRYRLGGNNGWLAGWPVRPSHPPSRQGTRHVDSRLISSMADPQHSRSIPPDYQNQIVSGRSHKDRAARYRVCCTSDHLLHWTQKRTCSSVVMLSPHFNTAWVCSAMVIVPAGL